MRTRAKEFRYEAALDRAGRMSAQDGPVLDPGEEWSPEHLLLVGLLRCSLKSLRYHAHRSSLDAVGSGSAVGLVTRRDEDGRYAFVEIEVRLEIELEPVLPESELGQLLAKAERDCFISASLTTKPRYRWRVNGVERLDGGQRSSGAIVSP